jgi:hypothetical protein
LSGEILKEALQLKGSQLFDPSNKKRPMKEWAQISYDYHDKWEQFAKEAINYVKNDLI